MSIRTWGWTIYKFVDLIMTILWRIIRLIYRPWYMILPKSIWSMRLVFFSTDFYFTLFFYFIGWISLSFSFWWLLQLRYPQCCLEFKYDPTFPIRGLYYDKLKGCLLKLDFFGSIEPDGCYFGRRKVLGIIILFIWMFYALTENDPWNGICLEIGVCLLCLWTW